VDFEVRDGLEVAWRELFATGSLSASPPMVPETPNYVQTSTAKTI